MTDGNITHKDTNDTRLRIRLKFKICITLTNHKSQSNFDGYPTNRSRDINKIQVSSLLRVAHQMNTDTKIKFQIILDKGEISD